MWLVALLLLLLVLSFVFYKWATLNYKTFEQLGLPYEAPMPFFGNFAAVMLNKESASETLKNFYNRNKFHKICGFFNFRKPIFVVNDPDIIKKITVKDFEHFPNHLAFIETHDEPLFEGMVSIMKDQRWKNMRNTLTPVFTASKMRSMFALMSECFDESLKFLRGKTPNKTGYELELKEFFTRLSNDIIASTAFGLKVNSYVDRSNEFYNIGQSITNFRGSTIIKFLIANISPVLVRLLGVKIFEREKTDFFMRLVIDTMKQRAEQKIVRPDMIQLLMEAKYESPHNWSDEEIVAQCFIFFFAAFENNANLICTMCHELMENVNVQERLYEEAEELRAELNGAPLNYDAVNKMKYMDMVVSETLRKWSIAAFTDRVCAKDYKVTDEDGNFVYEFKAGDHLWFSIVGLHWDERYFESPEVFDPERFSDENKESIKPFTYLPFGAGPRNCIGNRYALMQAKAMLYYLILDYKLERSPKTVPDLMKNARGFAVGPVDGFWLRLVPRK